MSAKLVIRDDVVQSCIASGRASYQQLEGASGFAEGLADAAGTNGPFAQTLRDAEQAWRIRREKLLESLKNVIDSIEAINQAFEDADNEAKKSFEDSTGTADELPDPTPPTDKPQPAQSDTTTSGGTATTTTSSGTATTTAPTSAGVTPLPAPFTPSAESPVAPAPAAPGSAEQTLFPDDLPQTFPQPIPAELPPKLLALVTEFVARWSQLTGLPVEQVAALVLAGAGGGLLAILAASGLIPAPQPGGAGALPGVGPKRGATPAESDPAASGGEGRTDDVTPGGSNGGDGGADPTADEAGSGASSQVGSDGPSGEPVTDADLPPLTSVPDGELMTAFESTSPEDHAAGGGGAETGTSSPGDPVSPDVVDSLTPGPDQASGSTPVDLPPLSPQTDLGGGAGGSGGGAGIDLPPLEAAADASTAATSGAGSGAAALPDLTVEPSAAVIVAPGEDAAMPDLGVHPAETGSAPRPSPAMGGMMGGMMGGGAAGGSPVSAGGGTSGPGADRAGTRQAVKDVLGAREGDEAR